MNYWLTTHYPHQTIDHPYHLYLKDRYRESFGRAIEVGDRVAFYELKGRRGNGRQAVIALARVSGSIEPNTNPGGGPDGAGQQWEWQFPCDGHEFGAGVTKDELDAILNWRPRIPGGLVQLDSEQFEQIERLFRRQRQADFVKHLGTFKDFMTIEELRKMREMD